MTSVYKPRDRYDPSFTPERCKASVHERGLMRSHQCSRKLWKDGWCKQHHPDTEAERRKERALGWELRHERSSSFRLGKALEEIARLKARIAELEGKQP